MATIYMCALAKTYDKRCKHQAQTSSLLPLLFYFQTQCFLLGCQLHSQWRVDLDLLICIRIQFDYTLGNQPLIQQWIEIRSFEEKWKASGFWVPVAVVLTKRVLFCSQLNPVRSDTLQQLIECLQRPSQFSKKILILLNLGPSIRRILERPRSGLM